MGTAYVFAPASGVQAISLKLSHRRLLLAYFSTLLLVNQPHQASSSCASLATPLCVVIPVEPSQADAVELKQYQPSTFLMPQG